MNARLTELIIGLSLVLAAVPARSVAQNSTTQSRRSDKLADAVTTWSEQALDLPDDLPASFDVTVNLGGAMRIISLTRHSIRDPNFKLYVADATGQLQEVEAPPSRTYRGHVKGIAGSIVSGALKDGQLSAIIDLGDDSGQWAIEPQPDMVEPHLAGNHVVYHKDDVIPQLMPCGAQGMDSVLPAETQFESPGQRTQSGGGGPVLELELAIDTDFALYSFQGENIANTVFDVEMVLGTVDNTYRNQLEICLKVNTIIVRPFGDDYSSVSDDYSLATFLDELEAEWNADANLAAIDRDVVHMMSGQGTPAYNPVGIARLNAVCDTPVAYGLSLTHALAPYLERVALTAHEIGHNLGACHCDDTCDVVNDPNCDALCATLDPGCGIMCARIGDCDLQTFSITSRQMIQQFVNSPENTCLEPCQTPPGGGGHPGDYGDAPVGNNGEGVYAYAGVLGRFPTFYWHRSTVIDPIRNHGTWLRANAINETQEHDHPGDDLEDVPDFLTFWLGAMPPTSSYDSVQNVDAPENDSDPVIIVDDTQDPGAPGFNPLAGMLVNVTASEDHDPSQPVYLNVFIDQQRKGFWRDGLDQNGGMLFAWNLEWVAQDIEVDLTPGRTSEVFISDFRLQNPFLDHWMRIMVTDRPVGAMYREQPPIPGSFGAWDSTMPGLHNVWGEVEDFHLMFYANPDEMEPGKGGIVLKSVVEEEGGVRNTKPFCYLRWRKIDYTRPLFENRPFHIVIPWCPAKRQFGLEYKKIDVLGGCAGADALLGFYGFKHAGGVNIPPTLNRAPGNGFNNAANTMVCPDGTVLTLPAAIHGVGLLDQGTIPVSAITNGPGQTRDWETCFPNPKRWRLFRFGERVMTCGSEVQHHSIVSTPEDMVNPGSIDDAGQVRYGYLSQGHLIENFVDLEEPPRPFPDPRFENYQTSPYSGASHTAILSPDEYVTEPFSFEMINAIYNVQPDIPPITLATRVKFHYRWEIIEIQLTGAGGTISESLGFVDNWTEYVIDLPPNFELVDIQITGLEGYIDQLIVELKLRPEPLDCDGDGVEDVDEIIAGAPDCNHNAVPDDCDVSNGDSEDSNDNGVPDECEPPLCPADLDGDGVVGAAALAITLGSWGPCPACSADLNGDEVVGAADLAIVLGSWGECVDPPPDSDCCEDNGTPGCDDPDCEATVCEVDPVCCDGSWDALCANEAAELCAVCGGGP